MLPLVNQCLKLIHVILQLIPENILWDRRPSRLPPAAESTVSDKKKREFQPGSDVIEYVRDFYCIRGHRRGANSSGTIAAQNGSRMDGDLEIAEDAGDLASTGPTISGGMTSTQQIISSRPQFEPIRGSQLVQELTKHMTQFTVDLVDSYIVPPNNQDTGVDVGVDGKRLRNIDAQLEKILHGVCSTLTFVAKHTDERFTWDSKDQEQLMRALLMCCQEGREFGVVDAGLSTLTQLTKRPRFLKGHELKDKAISKRIMNNVCGYALCSRKTSFFLIGFLFSFGVFSRQSHLYFICVRSNLFGFSLKYHHRIKLKPSLPVTLLSKMTPSDSPTMRNSASFGSFLKTVLKLQPSFRAPCF